MEELEIDLELNDEENEDILDVKELSNKVVNKDKKGNITYKYPFRMYFGHDYRDVSHIFEKNKEYTEKQILDELKNHGYKEFKYANAKLEFIEDENCLFVKFIGVGSRG